MKNLIEKINKIFKKIEEDHVGEYAAECAFFTVLSFIPFIIFFLTLIQFTNLERGTIYFWIKEVVPSTMHGVISKIIDEVYSKSLGTISIALIVALWSASKSFYYLSKGLRKIYKTEKQKNNILRRIEGIIYTIVFACSTIGFLIIMVLGSRIHQILINNFYAIGMITSYIFKIRGLILFVIMFFIFLLIYKYIPKNRLKMKDQAYGAIFSALSWAISSWFFSIYINIFKGFTNTYGSLTSVILIMMWVYSCMYIILLGAEINMYMSMRKRYKN